MKCLRTLHVNFKGFNRSGKAAAERDPRFDVLVLPGLSLPVQKVQSIWRTHGMGYEDDFLTFRPFERVLH